MKSNRLKLNTDKTQFIWLGSRQQLQKLNTTALDQNRVTIDFQLYAKSIGVTFDQELSMVAQINSVSRLCFYQLKQLRSVRSALTWDAALTLVHAFISSRVDYCNALFFGITDTAARKLQAILNAAARLVTPEEAIRPHHRCAEG